MTDFVKKVTGTAKELADTLVDKAEDAFDVLSDKAEDAFEVVKERGTELRDRAQASLRETPVLNRAKAMNMMTVEEGVLPAFEKYYHEDVVMQENDEEPRRGKAANREFLTQWAANVEAVHGGGVGAIASNEADQVSMVESWIEVTFVGGNRQKLQEVAIQHWKGDKIIRERFYYKG